MFKHDFPYFIDRWAYLYIKHYFDAIRDYHLMEFLDAFHSKSCKVVSIIELWKCEANIRIMTFSRKNRLDQFRNGRICMWTSGWSSLERAKLIFFFITYLHFAILNHFANLCWYEPCINYKKNRLSNFNSQFVRQQRAE